MATTEAIASLPAPISSGGGQRIPRGIRSAGGADVKPKLRTCPADL